MYSKIPRARAQAVRNLLPSKRPLAVLDVGCGAGSLGEILKKDSSIRVYGTDISPQAVEEARTRLDGAWILDIEKGVPSIEQSAPQQFDAVIFSEVLEHLFSPEKALRSIVPLLSTDGNIVITVPNILFWKNRIRIFLGHFEYEERGLMDRGHIHFFSWKSLRDMVHSEGFVIDSISHIIPTRGTKILGNIFPGLFAHQFAVRLRKKT